MKRAPLRSCDTKKGPSVLALAEMSIRHLTQCLLLYPQDADLQCSILEQINKQVSELCPKVDHFRPKLRNVLDFSQLSNSSHASLNELLGEVQASAVLPVVVNAMEVLSDSIECSRFSIIHCILQARERSRMHVRRRCIRKAPPYRHLLPLCFAHLRRLVELSART